MSSSCRFHPLLRCPQAAPGGRGLAPCPPHPVSLFTCESLRPSLAANFFLSGLLMYFCFWNIFSSALRCTSEKTARRSMPRRGFPRAASGQEKVPGMGTTAEAAGGGTHRAQRSRTGPHHPLPALRVGTRQPGAVKRSFRLNEEPPFQPAIPGIRSINSNV